MNTFSLSLSSAPADKGLQFCFENRGEILLAWKSNFILNIIFFNTRISALLCQSFTFYSFPDPTVGTPKPERTTSLRQTQDSLIINGL